MNGSARLEPRGAVARATLDRPPGNALSFQLVSDLAAIVSKADKEAGVRVVVLCGAGNTFSAGTDLRELEGADPKRLVAAAQLGQDVAWRIEHSEKIWIAAVEGLARGGGLDLALACDLLVAAEDAKFESPEVGEGWIPFFGGTQRLRQALGKARAREAILTSAPIGAEDAHAIGFVNRVVPKGCAVAAAEALAGEIAARPWAAVKAAKKVLVEQLDKPYRNGFLLEAQYFTQLMVERKSAK